MVEVPKLLYIVVVDNYNDHDLKHGERCSFRYTRSLLQSTLQLMGCKARHAFKISRRVFDLIRTEESGNVIESPSGKPNDQNKGDSKLEEEDVDASNTVPFELYKRQTTVVVPREVFLRVTCDVLSQYKYVGPNQRADFILACRIRERKESVTVLLCGTSGCGKSTLSALLGGRLGVTNVISTDSIRHMLRSFANEEENPLLWASTYHAGECLDPIAVAEAKAKKKAKKLARPIAKFSNEDQSEQDQVIELLSRKQMAIEGYKAQSEMVIDSLDQLVTAWEERKESAVVEGAHLSLNFVMGLMKRHPSIIPFMIYITSEEKHMERFAVRAKYMTLDPAKNKYVKYIRNIRTIQEYLCKRADKHLVPKINNTNVDRSVAAIHAAVFSSLRRREAGEPLYDSATNTVSVVHEEYKNQCTANNSLSSKGMFQLIQRKGSSRHLMALLNNDGSVAKAWPVESTDDNDKSTFCNGNEKRVGSPMYGPLLIGKAEPVNLQFGNFGISAWPNDTCGTSNAGSNDDCRADVTDSGSRYFSSCASSPRPLDAPAKNLKEDLSVSGSDEEVDDPPEVDTEDEDLSDVDIKEIPNEMEGSVDEDSTKSDEEYEDLAMRDYQDSNFSSDEEQEFNKENKLTFNTKAPLNTDNAACKNGDKYEQNLSLFLELSKRFGEVECAYSMLPEKKERKSVEHARVRTRSLMLSPVQADLILREPAVLGAALW